MGNKVLVEISSDLPPSLASWKVDVGDDVKLALAVTNIYYDVLAAATAKIGVEISKYLVDQDHGRLNTEVEKVVSFLNDPGTTLG